MKESIALTLIDGIGPARANLLIRHYGSAAEVFRVSAKELHSEGHLPASVAERFSYSLYESEVDRILSWCESNHVTPILPDSDFYPELLAQTYDPPTVLYGMGNLELLNQRSIALVGMRKISDYGKKAAVTLTNGLCDADMVIVSGLAYGADAIAHEAALDHHGKTVAVMATGPDRIYPSSHRDLAARIFKTGAILTEYPPGSGGNKYQFVQRNRIVAGMTEATVVVEAGHKSGSLITANFALAQGREVFAVPGSIFSGCSVGTNELIAAGATPALSAAQIMAAIHGDTFPVGDSQPTAIQVSLFEERLPDYLSPEELTILKVLRTDHPFRVDEIADSTEMTIDSLFTILLSLEMNTLIQQVPGGGYRRI